MHLSPLGLVVPCLSLLALAPSHAQAQRAPLPRFEPGECRVQVPTDRNADCGFLVVPETRAARGAVREVRVAVAVVRNASGATARDPVLFMSGSWDLPSVLPDSLADSGVFAGRDIIIVDRRGAGASLPSLKCQEVDAAVSAAYPNSPPTREYLSAVLRCRERLVAAGINLAAYDTAESARDLKDLRTVLGYKTWNLSALSAGGFVALELMRIDAPGIRSVLLDSAVSPTMDWARTSAEPGSDDLDRVFVGCRSDPICDAVFPDLERRFFDFVHALRAHPRNIFVANPSGGAPLEVRVDGDLLLSVAVRGAGDRNLAGRLPGIIDFALSNSGANLRVVFSQFVFNAPPGVALGAEGKRLSSVCREWIAFQTLAELTDALRDFPEFSRAILSVDLRAACVLWQAGRARSAIHEPVTSDIPTLILAGQIDHVVSPADVKGIGDTLRRAYVFEFPAFGHLVLPQDPCPQRMARAFFDDPTSRPDDACIAALPPLSFTPRF